MDKFTLVDTPFSVLLTDDAGGISKYIEHLKTLGKTDEVESEIRAMRKRLTDIDAALHTTQRKK